MTQAMERQDYKWRTRAGIFGLIMAAIVAAIISYTHQRQLAITHRQSGFAAMLWPLSIDGLVIACGARLAIDNLRGVRRSGWATVGFWGGFAISLTANWFSVYRIEGQLGVWIDHAIAASPALCLLLAWEALMARPRAPIKPAWSQVRGGGGPPAMDSGLDPPTDDAEVFVRGALDEPTREWQPVPEPASASNGRRKKVPSGPSGGDKFRRAYEAAERWPGLGRSELARRVGVSRTHAGRAITAVRQA